MQNRSREALEAALLNPEMEDVSDIANVKVHLRYGTKQNLLNRDVYGGFQRAILHKIAAQKFRNAAGLLAVSHPSLKLLVFDALRPQAAQAQFWELVKGTPQEPYFANPEKGSLHSYGFAIDLGLETAAGQELDMATGFDDLSELAEPKREQEFLKTGRLSVEQLQNRLVLRNVMEKAGFIQLPHEWWHFDALPGAQVRARFQRYG